MDRADLIASLTNAVEAAPDDTTLRLHLAELLLETGDQDGALRHLGLVLASDPTSAQALDLIARVRSDGGAEQQAVHVPDDDGVDEMDWEARAMELADVIPPMFVEREDDSSSSAEWRTERSDVTLADVGGMPDVKERLELAFLAPLRNPELRRAYGKSLRGGLLLFGPPGCGKSFIARALAGELGAGFLSVSLNDVLDSYVGSSEANLHGLFVQARGKAPCVVFFDEIDALGHRRSRLQGGYRTTVNQLLIELDGVEHDNEGVFVLAATNHPWDVDPALRRPGRFDRTVLVLPPDEVAREAIFRANLAERPVASIDLARLAHVTDGFSGADIAHVCESAAEKALIESARGGEIRLIEMRHVDDALAEVRPSLAGWFEAARNVVAFANTSGDYDGLRDYMKRHRLL